MMDNFEVTVPKGCPIIGYEVLNHPNTDGSKYIPSAKYEVQVANSE
jgi:hypothetical protein